MAVRERIFVTGATSEIMRRFIDRVDRDRYELIGLSRRAVHPDGRIKWVTGDIRNTGLLAEAMQGCRILVHAAAITHARRPREYDEINFQATARLVIAANQAGIRKVIFISTRAAGYDSGAYGISKKMAEENIAANSREWLVLRLAEVYGLQADRDFITKMITYVLRNRVVFCPVGMAGRLAPIHVDDAADIIHDLVCNRDESKRIITVNGAEEFSLAELFSHVAGLVQKRIRIIPVPARIMFLVQHMLQRVPFSCGIVPDQIPRLYSAKESQDLGYRLHSIDEYIAGMTTSARG